MLQQPSSSLVMRSFACFAFVGLFPAFANAHETWALPEGVIPTEPATITLELTSGEAFPTPGTGPKSSRLAKMEVSSSSGAGHAVVDVETPVALKLLVDLPEGLSVVAVSLTPHDIDLKPDKVAEYLGEVEPSRSVSEAWRSQPAPQVWRETYVKNAKTLICVGLCKADRWAMRPVHAHLEIVPTSPGPSPRTFLLLAAGHPLAGRRIDVFDDHGPRTQLKTDQRGAFHLSQRTEGWTMVSAIWLRPPSETGARFQSDFASLVFNADEHRTFAP
jgi:uncharacterized GH25 family protein